MISAGSKLIDFVILSSLDPLPRFSHRQGAENGEIPRAKRAKDAKFGKEFIS